MGATAWRADARSRACACPFGPRYRSRVTWRRFLRWKAWIAAFFTGVKSLKNAPAARNNRSKVSRIHDGEQELTKAVIQARPLLETRGRSAQNVRMTVLRFTQMKKTLGFTTIAALLVSTGAASAALIQVPCRGAVGEDQPTEFTIAIDLALSVITEGDFRWTTTDDDATIDWNLHRQTGALRGVVLTGADAGVLIVGACNQSAERNF